jgi:hypothetical protein
MIFDQESQSVNELPGSGASSFWHTSPGSKPVSSELEAYLKAGSC